jgi:hypothetical protein
LEGGRQAKSEEAKSSKTKEAVAGNNRVGKVQQSPSKVQQQQANSGGKVQQ